MAGPLAKKVHRAPAWPAQAPPLLATSAHDPSVAAVHPQQPVSLLDTPANPPVAPPAVPTSSLQDLLAATKGMSGMAGVVHSSVARDNPGVAGAAAPTTGAVELSPKTQGQALAAPMMGLGPKKMRLRGGSTTRTTTQGRYTAAEATQIGKTLDARAKAAQDSTQDKLGLIAKSQEALQRRRLQLQDQEMYAGADAHKLKLSHDEATKRLEGITKRISDHKVDYERYYKRNSKALGIIGIMLGALAEGWTKGRLKNSGLKIFNAAIERDVAEQRAELSLMMKQAGLAQGKQDRIMRQWMRREGIQRQAARDLAVVELEQAKTRLQIPAAQERLDDLIGKIGLQKVEAKAGSRSKTTVQSTSSYRDVAVSPSSRAAAIGKEPKDKFKRYVEGAAQTLTAINDALSRIKKGGYGQISRWTPGSKAYEVRQMFLPRIAVTLRKATGEGGVMTEQDFQRYKGTVQSFWLGGQETIKRLKQLRSEIQRNTAMALRTRSNYGYNVRPLSALFGGRQARASSAAAKGRAVK